MFVQNSFPQKLTYTKLIFQFVEKVEAPIPEDPTKEDMLDAASLEDLDEFEV
jgi:hypothetical protein